MRQTAAIIFIALFVGTMIAIAYKAGQPRQELLSPEAQMDDTLLIDHSRIPEDTPGLIHITPNWFIYDDVLVQEGDSIVLHEGTHHAGPQEEDDTLAIKAMKEAIKMTLGKRRDSL